jgi:hypothetical protein
MESGCSGPAPWLRRSRRDTAPAAIVQVIDDMQPVGPGRWQIDGVKLHAHLREQNLGSIDADAELHADGDHDVVYVARLDEVPDAAF